MHIHLGLVSAIKVFLEVLVVGFFWRLIAMHNSDNSVGQAMSVLY